MMNTIFPFEQINSDGIEDTHSSSKVFEIEEGRNEGKQIPLNEIEDWREAGQIESLSSGFEFCQNNTAEEGLVLSKYQEQEQQIGLFPGFGILDDFHFEIVSRPSKPYEEEFTKLSNIQTGISNIVEAKNEKSYPFPLASLQHLKNYQSRLKRLNGVKQNVRSCKTSYNGVSHHKLSTEEIMRMAGERFIQSSFQRIGNLSMLSHPFSFNFSGLSDEETRGIELAFYLLASAEKVGYQQYEQASALLSQCDYLSSKSGDPVQRVTYYFSEALREKIDRETGRITAEGLGNKHSFNVEEAIMSLNPTTLAWHQGMPFSQVLQFTGIQAILENLAGAKRVHLIDLGIGNGVQWTGLMQALAVRHECPIELLKITAVGTTARGKIEETGKRLASFAKTMNLPFSFNVVMLSDMLNLNKDLFELEATEAVAVYSPCVLWTLIARPNRLESFMTVIRNINPCVLVVSEIEANHNSPFFVNRFVEALFFFGAWFDCLETCMDRNDSNRIITESLYFDQGIRNIVATEGEERTIRHVKIDVWRAFFARFGIVETELSTSSLDQASLVVKNFSCENSCTLDMNGKCLIIGWRGTPIHSLSAWKFV